VCLTRGEREFLTSRPTKRDCGSYGSLKTRSQARSDAEAGLRQNLFDRYESYSPYLYESYREDSGL